MHRGEPPTPAPDRLHALDAARGLALLLGIVLHATMSFFLSLPARDRSESVALAVTFYVIHTFRMTLFYVIAGFFGHLVFHRRGDAGADGVPGGRGGRSAPTDDSGRAREFVRDRAKRVLVPMTAGWVILAPPTIAALAWGLSRTYPDGSPAGAPAVPQGFPLIHLWFLYYLCLLYVAALAFRAWFVAVLDEEGGIRARIDALLGTGLRSRLAPLALAAPTVAVLYLDSGWAVWFGIPTPDRGFTPQLPPLVAFGTAFAAGWLLHRQVALLDVLRRQWSANLVVAAGLTAACLAIVGPMPSLATPTVLGGGAATRFVYACCYALSIWYGTFALIGAAMRFGSGESAVRRYLADASYWLYLAHPPIVFGLQALLMNVPLHWAFKLPLILAISLTVLLVSYHHLVRPTLVGEVLNGRRYPRHAGVLVPPAPAASARTLAGGAASIAELLNVTKRYGKTVALDGLSLAVRPGELLAVLGPNGAGKSTAIGLWLGTLEPDEGIARVLGGSPLDVRSRLGVGVMMQEVALAPMLTAREHVALAASYYRDPLPVEETLVLTGAKALAGRRYSKLSGGEKRQVQFATAVCGRPRLLFLDEPTVGLDVKAREAMWRTIRRLRDEGCAVVLTTHYLEEAEALADRVAVIAKGTLIAEGSVDEMRSLVTRSRISCVSGLAVEEIERWPGVVEAVREGRVVRVTATDADAVVRRLLAADPDLHHLQVEKASLAEAFNELTKLAILREQEAA